MKRYIEYKDSGVDWIREIPVHWEMINTKYLFRLVTEPAPKNNDYELLSIYTDIGVKPRKELEERGNRATTTDGYWLVKKDDFIVNKLLAWMGAIGLSDYDGVTSPAYDILRKIRPLNERFYEYLFRCGLYFTEFKKWSRGIMEVRLRLYFDQFGQIPLVFPSVDEQAQIANFLDRKTGQIDELLHIKARRIELLQEQQTALINQAVTKGLDPSVEMKPSEVEWIGKIPRHWTMKRLKHVTESIKNGTTAPQIQSGQTDYPVTRIETISTGKINFDKVGHVNYWAGIENYRLRLGDILLSHINSLAILGNCAMFENSASLYHGMNLLRIRPNNLTDDRFLLYWLKSYATNQLIKSFAKFAIGQVSISITNLKEIPISYPLLSEQTQIANFLDRKTKQIDELISTEQQKIELLKEYRQSLISEAVTGKIDVRNEV